MADLSPNAADRLRRRYTMLEQEPDATWLDLIDVGLLDSGSLIYPERVLPPTVDSSRLDLVDEFKRTPLGPHSSELQQLTWILRSQCPNGRYVLTTDHGNPPLYRVARLERGRGRPLEYVHGAEFGTVEEAEWATFALRWRDHTGQALPLQRSEAT